MGYGTLQIVGMAKANNKSVCNIKKSILAGWTFQVRKNW